MKILIIAALLGLAIADDGSQQATSVEGGALSFTGFKAPHGIKFNHHKERRAAATCGTATAMTTAQQTQIINTHNTYRAQEGASNMMLQTYSDEMARVAQGYANKCIWGHGDLYDCEGNRLGQNLFVISNANGYPALNTTYVVAAWYGEKAYYTQSSQACNPPPGGECGHYTQVAWARSGQVGCGFAQCPTMNVGGSTWKNALFVVCDYTQPGNVEQTPMWTAGAACSNCDSDQTGAGFKCVNGLCASCQPASDPACKCGTPVQCVTGSWNPGTCSCQCPPDHYGVQCEVPCTCNDVPAAQCSTMASSCSDPSYAQALKQYCKQTCNFPCQTSQPASCTQTAAGY